jgi:hypothetical protein
MIEQMTGAIDQPGMPNNRLTMAAVLVGGADVL